MKTHEVMITADGSINKKNLPSDAFYKSVTIKESRKHKQIDLDNAPLTESEESDMNNDH